MICFIAVVIQLVYSSDVALEFFFCLFRPLAPGWLRLGPLLLEVGN